MYSVSLAR
jgi:hypothetical protein